jgi:asparagine synthase (glutamine-hydrolysing)
MIRGVSKLPAGHTMTVDITKWEKKTHCYWRMEDAPALDGNPVELLDAQLQEIGKQIIRSDVPVGVALSGGLDSSLVAALAARYSPQKIHALTVGYEGSVESDERGAAKKFAQYLDIPWTDIQLSTSEVIAGLPELVLRMDDPIGDIAGYGYYAVMRGARDQNLPVMLQGQGGDELFWGYSWVRDAAARSRLKALATQHGWKAFGNYWRAELPCSKSIKDVRRWFKKLMGLSPALRKLQYDCSTPRNQLAFYNMSNEYQAAEELKNQLFSKTYLHELPKHQAASLFSKDELWEDIDTSLTKLICETYLIENGMAQGDRLSMASSVELRLPLVDYRFVETVIGIRKNKSDYNDTPKKHLRDVAAGILPDWVMNRKKRGFSPPVDQWMNGIQTRYGKNLNDGFLIRQGILDQSTVHSMTKSQPQRGPMRNVWHALIVLELWSREMEGLELKSSQDE